MLVEENLCERSRRLGEIFRTAMNSMKYDWIIDVRGRGLFNAIEIDPAFRVSAYELCLNMKENGLLAKQTHDNIIRFAPPLVISDEELLLGSQIITDVFKEAHEA